MQDIYARLDAALRNALSPMPPCAINHSLSMRVVNNNDPWETARKLGEAIQRLKWTIKGCTVNARAEQSATRKKAWSMYYNRLQNIKDISMSVKSIPAYIMVGQLRFPNENPNWIWNEAGCQEVGLSADRRAAAEAENERPAKRPATDDAPIGGGGLGGLGDL